MGVFRLLVRSAKADKSLADLLLFSFREWQLGFVGKILGDGIGAKINAPGIDLALFEKQEVAGFGADVEQHGAILKVAVIIAEGVAKGRRGDIRQLKAQAGGFSDAEKTLDNVRLDGDKQHFQLASGSGTEYLIVPNHFSERERNILLRLI